MTFWFSLELNLVVKGVIIDAMLRCFTRFEGCALTCISVKKKQVCNFDPEIRNNMGWVFFDLHKAWKFENSQPSLNTGFTLPISVLQFFMHKWYSQNALDSMVKEHLIQISQIIMGT